jgi:hypothetical protein
VNHQLQELVGLGVEFSGFDGHKNLFCCDAIAPLELSDPGELPNFFVAILAIKRTIGNTFSYAN